MHKVYRLLFFVVLIPVLFSGCDIEKWANDAWKNDKIFVILGLLVFFVIIILLFRYFIKCNAMKKSNKKETFDSGEQEFFVDDNSSNNTEYINIGQDDATDLDNIVEIEKPVLVNTISVFIKGEKKETFKIPDDGTVIGRDPSKAGLIISEAIVSKTHLKITPKDEEYLIEDLNSTNGTFVNGKQISSATISNEDILTIGKKGNIVIKFE